MTTLEQRFSQLRPRIDADVSQALEATLSRLHATDTASAFFDAACDSVRSGKRFRALLAHFGASLVCGQPLGEFPVHLLGAALELYQASALVHDDLIDNAATRRGMTTPHIRFAKDHAQAQWSGSPHAFGSASAVLLGDLLFSAAEVAMTLQCSQLPTAQAEQLFARYSHMHLEVALGQYLDVRAENLPLSHEAPNLDAAMDVVLRKSARYSIVQPVLLGATAAGADAATLDALEKILTPWGIAFQLRDDELGVFGQPILTGKPAGDDIREGKRTVLLALTWERATAEDTATLARVLGSADASSEDIAQATRIIDAHGRAPHEDLIDTLVAQGSSALAESDLPDSAASDMLQLAHVITARSK